MKLSLSVSDELKQKLGHIWTLSPPEEIIEITSFGDFFVRKDDEYFLYSLTDGEVQDVTNLINEHGLPPVSIELGDEWYQLDALSALEDIGLSLDEGQCFGFIIDLDSGGDYSLDNIEKKYLEEYHQAKATKGLDKA